VLERARELARREGIYLELGFMVILPSDHSPFWQNRAVLVNPVGRFVPEREGCLRHQYSCSGSTDPVHSSRRQLRVR